MKQFIIIMAALFAFSGVNAQGVNRGTYGTQSGYASTPFKLTNYTGVRKAALNDTLTNADTGFFYIWVGQGFDQSVEFTANTLTGTVTPVALALYGYNNNGVALTAAQAYSLAATPVSVYTVTGNTTYCGGCVGAASTTVPGATKTYKYQIPKSAGCLFDNYIGRWTVGGTATSTYKANLITQY